VPVVPLVYWMIATSSVAAGKDAGGGACRSFSQAIAPDVRSVSAARDSRAFASGRCSAKRRRMAARVTTETTFVTATSAGNCWTVETTLLHDRRLGAVILELLAQFRGV
jgi:hypothetical protein